MEHKKPGHFAFSILAALFVIVTYPKAVSAQEYACFGAVADSYVQKSQADTNFGGAGYMRLLWLDANADQALAYLQFDLSAIPSNALISSATLSLYLESASAAASFGLYRVTSPWQEFNITWNNRPGATGLFDNPFHSDITGRKQWNAIQPVSDWVSGAFANYGLLISSGLLDGPNDFVSRQGQASRRPELCVNWTVGGITDLVVTGMEVTQSIQDMNNSVPLVAGKRTFVRLYGRGTDQSYRTFAQLSVTCDQFGRILHPVNNGNGYTVIKTSPSRNVLDDAFLFELPSDCTDEPEQIQIIGMINPEGYSRGRYPPESNILNNVTPTEYLTFETVPPLDINVRLGKYEMGDTAHVTAESEAFHLRSWLLRAYPISDVSMVISPYWMGKARIDAKDGFVPTSGDINKKLRKLRKINIDEYGASKQTIHYALVTDEGGFMRGSASNPVGSGPTGDPSEPFPWDTDNSYGDWYGGHEIGHALFRAHVDCNGNEDDPDKNYPHSGGLISGTTTGDAALFGFDSRPVPTIYGPGWSDVMTYCSNQWISDYTYKAIKNAIQDEFSGQAAFSQPAGLPAQDSYLVTGSIHNGQVTLDPVFLYPDVIDPGDTIPGDFSIVLRAQNGAELARKAFTPTLVASGADRNGGVVTPGISTLLFEEWMPEVAGTQKISIEGPGGELASIEASNNAPTVQVTVPNGSETISGSGIRVEWIAGDVNGDDIWFNVEFSPDNGATWTVLAWDIYDEFLEVDRSSLQSTNGANGLFRVWVSDGFHTGVDQSDTPFTVTTKAPSLNVISPVNDQYVSANQTLNLQAEAYSDLVGIMDGDQPRWVSTVDGLLGTGDQVSVTGLTPGTHAIVIVANDGTRTSSTTRTVHVTEFPSQLPQPGLGLAVSPGQIAFRPDLGMNQAVISIDNQAGTNPMAWLAAELVPWLTLSSTSGNTPATITATVNTNGLTFGDYSANIVVVSPDIPGGGSKTVRVGFSLYAPSLMFKDGFE